MYYYGEQSLGKGNQTKPLLFLAWLLYMSCTAPLDEKDVICHHPITSKTQNKGKTTQIEQSIY